MRRIVIAVILLAPAFAFAADSFTLKNSYPRTATFQFFSKQTRRWEDPACKLNFSESQLHTLKSSLPYLVQFHTDDGYVERLGVVDFHHLVGDSQGKLITLEQLYVTETRTRTVSVERLRTEERTREFTVMRSVPETKTRTIKRYDPQTGKTYYVTEAYTVMTMVPETKTSTYSVQVPYTESVQQSYIVQVPRAVAMLGSGGNKQELRGAPELVMANPQGADETTDPRRRFLGVGLGDSPQGPVVTSVVAGSPAAKLRKLGLDKSRRFVIVPHRNAIIEVNGKTVKTSDQLVDAIQQSPPLVLLKILDRRTGNTATFEARLEMQP